MQPLVIKKAALVEILREVARGVERGDSFEGSLQYTCMDETLAPDEFLLSGSVRTGNLLGQGGMVLFGTSEPPKEEAPKQEPLPG